ncbi:MAG: hypothetical protein R3B90_18145 [Planctomycetaceae bacterium]
MHKKTPTRWLSILMRLSLIPLGLTSALVLGIPSLVVLGLWLLILPGLILAAIPTIFVYLLATTLVRLALPIRNDFVANLAAFGLVLAGSAAVMAPLRSAAQQEFTRATLPDVAPATKLAITGDVLLEWPQETYPRSEKIDCDYLCLALLDVPGVTGVTRSCEEGTATFRKGCSIREQESRPSNRRRSCESSRS